MEEIIVRGGHRLNGEIRLQGSKNSALPILAATAAVGGKCIIHNCPRLTDTEAALRILEYIGCRVTRGDTVEIDASGVTRSDIPERLMREMRSSIVFLGPLLARTGCAVLCAPGGCEIGLRPIDLHLRSVELLGARVREEGGYLTFNCPNGLHGTTVSLSFPSVGATENTLIAACSASGATTIINAAREPEIVDLARFLNSCGAKIRGAGTDTVTVEGVKRLHPCEHRVISDRIAATTYMSAAAVTRGHIRILGAVPEHFAAVTSVYEQAGCEISVGEDFIEISASGRLKKLGAVRTMPYPGFPTDAQAAASVVAAVARGTTIIIENIFENRFRHVPELIGMGASISVEGRVAVIEGVGRLSGSAVTASDLRSGSALVIAGLAAEGTTAVRGVGHIDRGCERLCENLAALGASIGRSEKKDEQKSTEKIE